MRLERVSKNTDAAYIYTLREDIACAAYYVEETLHLLRTPGDVRVHVPTGDARASNVRQQLTDVSLSDARRIAADLLGDLAATINMTATAG